jgi:aminomethyltransferase
MPFMSGRPGVSVAGVTCTVTRCGYTGEDGYEIGMAPEHAERVARALLADARVKPAALGPRDSLRLEAGLCLYGHDIDDTTTPAEAVLGWTIAKARREAGRDNFPGAAKILGQLKNKSAPRKRVGMSVHGAPAREGAKIYAAPTDGSKTPSGTPLGVVTSGTFSPILKAPIAMGNVASASGAVGTKLAIEVRGTLVPATVTPLPFVPTKYYRSA